MVIWEARQQARQAVIRRIEAEGKVKVSLMSAAEIGRLAKEHLLVHSAELLRAAEASGTERRLVNRAAKSVCGSPVQNGEQK